MAIKNQCWPDNWPKSQNYPGKPVYNLLEQTANRVPNRIAIVFGGLEMTYSELKQLADRFASALLDLRVQKGDRVAIHLVNCPQFAIAYYGIMKIGAVFSPLSPMLSPREAEYQLVDCAAETLISLDLLYPAIAEIIPNTKVGEVITTSIADCYASVVTPVKPLRKTDIPGTIDFINLLEQHEPFAKEIDIDVENDLAHIAYTGGTTGLSKGVMLTHANIESNVLQSVHWTSGALVEEENKVWKTVYPAGIDPATLLTKQDQEISIVVVPWFHAMGVVGFLNSQVHNGNTMIVLPRFEAKDYLDNIVKYKATFIGGAPQLYIPLTNHPDFHAYDLSNVRFVGSGAAPLPVSVIEKMTARFGIDFISEGYGLTECTMTATLSPPSSNKAKIGSVGLPIFDTEVKIINPNTGEELPMGEEGEVVIKGPQVMKGYYNKPEATAEVLKDGWLHTGDIGKLDEDGYLYITDRLKDMIIYKGYNVYPRELEEVLFQHPAVEQCAVVGKPDKDTGEIPVAFIKLLEGQKATGEQLMAFLNSKVGGYKKLRNVFLVDAIPVNAAGKILKRELRRTIENTT